MAAFAGSPVGYPHRLPLTQQRVAMSQQRLAAARSGEPIFKRKRGRQKKVPSKIGPCGATTNLRPLMPRMMAEGSAANGSSPAGTQGVAPAGNPMAASHGMVQHTAILPAGAGGAPGTPHPSRYPTYPYVLQAVTPPY